MESFKEVHSCDVEESAVKNYSWKPFLRQLLVCTGVWTSQFVYGLCIGSPTVFIPQIRKEANSTEVISDEMASWLTSAFGFSGFPWVFILSVMTRLVGRKIPFIFAIIQTFVSFIVFYCSTTVNQILISLIMQGLLSASQIVISIVILTEYTSPKYRGIFLTIKSAILYWGIWAANTLGTFFHWKKIGLLGIICAVYTLSTVIFWPESPYWLASKGKYKECSESHRWLKGCDDEAEKELDILIKTQKEYVKSCSRVKLSRKEKVKDLYNTITSQGFYKPMFLANATGLLGVFSGKLVCTVYAIDIIKKITESESTAYTGMLILDGITVTSMYVGCILSKFIKRRTYLLITSCIGVFFLFSISFYLYLVKLVIISENKYASLGLLTLFSVAISSGPLIMSTSVYAELIPLRSRTLATCLIAISAKLSLGMVLKLSPSIFKAFNLHGTFMLFGILSSVCIVLLYKYLPETKDKTLQEIADCIRGNKKCKNETLEATEKLVVANNMT